MKIVRMFKTITCRIHANKFIRIVLYCPKVWRKFNEDAVTHKRDVDYPIFL